jgi:endonuclease VIII
VPEGHTIHRLAADLVAELGGQRVAASSPQGRFDASSIDGAVLGGARAVGKHLFLDFGGEVVHVHLGLFGKFRRQTGAPRPTVRLRLSAGDSTWDLVGPTVCERLAPPEVEALEERLGADPLGQAARPPRALWKSKRPIGAVLLDQSLIAGIGNVYRAEILFLLGLHPMIPAHQLLPRERTRVWKLAQKLLAAGVKQRRIVTVAGANARTRRRDAVHVYRRETCKGCGGPVATMTLAARTLYYCPACQPER